MKISFLYNIKKYCIIKKKNSERDGKMEIMFLNEKLYISESIGTEEYTLTDETIESIFENGKQDEMSYFRRGRKSLDWYEPDDPDEMELELSLTVPIEEIEKVFGELTEDDLENIYYFLSESDEIKEKMKYQLEEIKPQEVSYFDIDLTVIVNKKEIFIQAVAENIEIY